jgi:hypothetical protein
MNMLYRESPAVDRSAVANSTSQLDLSVLDRYQVCRVCASLEHASLYFWQIADDDGVPIEWPPSPTLDPGEGGDFMSDESSIAITPPVSPSHKPMTPAHHVKSEPPSSTRRVTAVKRKSMHGHIEDLTTSLGEARVKVARVREREQTIRIQAREDRKKAEFNSRLEYKAAEAERQRAHELAMLERQIELEHLRAQHFNAPPPFAGPPRLPVAGPSSQWAIDPSLN